ncbi:MAG TPA: hypothetical protein VM490_04210 [Armatimonadaceae bacterium]|nr:hypothetical protein [Armatimonadaceae bacterium]
MENKPSVSPVVLAVAVVLLLGFLGFVAFRSFGSGSGDNTAAIQQGAGGGDAAKTVAPVVQRYPDGSVVPYNAAPSGATPGDPSSVKR